MKVDLSKTVELEGMQFLSEAVPGGLEGLEGSEDTVTVEIDGGLEGVSEEDQGPGRASPNPSRDARDINRISSTVAFRCRSRLVHEPTMCAGCVAAARASN